MKDRSCAVFEGVNYFIKRMEKKKHKSLNHDTTFQAQTELSYFTLLVAAHCFSEMQISVQQLL